MLGYSRNNSVHSFLALRHAVRTPLELFCLKEPSLTLGWLLNVLDNSETNSSPEGSQDAAYDDMRSIDKLFEKGPSNTHREDCTLAEMVYREFCSCIEKNKDDKTIIAAKPQLLNKLGDFVRTSITNCRSSLPQDLLYYVYITVLGLAMMKVLIQDANFADAEDELLKEAWKMYTNTLQWIKNLRESPNEYSLYHFKLDEVTKLVLAESVTL